MRKILPKLVFLLSLLLIITACGEVEKKEKKETKEKTAVTDKANEEKLIAPVMKNGKEKFKIAIIQSGDYFAYQNVFDSFTYGATQIGWMNEVILPENSKKSIKDYLTELQKTSYSSYIEMSPDLFFDLNWDDKLVESPVFKNLISKESGVDLIFCLGTFAGQAILKQKDFNIPVIVDSVSDPVGSGLSKAKEDSGYDFLTVRIDPDEYSRQIRLFHDVVGFKKLGVIYEDSVNGKSYAAIEEIEKVAKEKGFEIVRNHSAMADASDDKVKVAQEMYLKGLEEILPKIDALYLVTSAGTEMENINNIVGLINKYKVPTFAMEGSRYVKKGVLLGVSESELKMAGIYNAKKMSRILKGEQARKLDQIFINQPKIAINLKAAEIIGYDVPIDIIGSSDEIYNKIEE